jgi:hypothetical protein
MKNQFFCYLLFVLRFISVCLVHYHNYNIMDKFTDNELIEQGEGIYSLEETTGI